MSQTNTKSSNASGRSAQNCAGFVMMRIGSPVVFWWALLLAATGCFAQSTTYTFTDLGLMPGSYQTVASGINSSGQVVETGYFGSGGTYHAGLYANGAHQDLGMLLPGQNSQGTAVNSSGAAINDAGQVTGAWFGGNGRVFLFSNGLMQDIGTLSGAAAGGSALNKTGQIAGSLGFFQSSPYPSHILFYDGTLHDLGTPFNALRAGASGINSSGQLIGSYSNDGPSTSPGFIYSNGSFQTIDPFAGDLYVSLMAINDYGKIVGYSRGDNGTHAFTYSNGVMQNLGHLPGQGDHAWAFATNNVGQIVGQAIVSGYNYGHAVLFSNGSVIDLNSLLSGR